MNTVIRDFDVELAAASHSCWADPPRLCERIEGAATILPTGEKRLAAEMAEHRRMLTEGWLSKARYDLAKHRIFALYRKNNAR